MFRRSSAGATEGRAQGSQSPQGTQSPEAPAKDRPAAEAGKGRPTPKRSTAEAGRYRSITGSTTSGRGPGYAPGAKKAKRTPEEKARDKAEWNRKQLAMRNGEEWALGPRDKGPVRKMARDYVDSHRRPMEYYIYALILLVIALVGGKSHSSLNAILQYFLIAVVVVIVVDAFFLRRTVLKLAAERFPNESTRGLAFYAIMRGLQLRRFRFPATRLKPGDKF